MLLWRWLPGKSLSLGPDKMAAPGWYKPQRGSQFWIRHMIIQNLFTLAITLVCCMMLLLPLPGAFSLHLRICYYWMHIQRGKIVLSLYPALWNCCQLFDLVPFPHPPTFWRLAGPGSETKKPLINLLSQTRHRLFLNNGFPSPSPSPPHHMY